MNFREKNITNISTINGKKINKLFFFLFKKVLSVDNDTLSQILHICITGDFSLSSFMRYQTFTCISNYFCAKFAYWVILWSCFVNLTIWVFPLSDVCRWSHTLNQEVLLSLKSNTHGMEEMLSALKVFLPWHKWVRLLQRGRVQLKQRGDVVPVSHRHQLVLDPLTERALVGATTIHLQRMWESRSSAEVESGQEAGERQQVRPLYFEGNASCNSPQAVAQHYLLYIQGSPAKKQRKLEYEQLQQQRRAETEEQDGGKTTAEFRM